MPSPELRSEKSATWARYYEKLKDRPSRHGSPAGLWHLSPETTAPARHTPPAVQNGPWEEVRTARPQRSAGGSHTQ